MPVPTVQSNSIRWPNLEGKGLHPELVKAVRQIYNSIDDHNQAWLAQSQKAQLVATIDTGVISQVDMVSAGTYSKIPTVTAVGGGGSGATFAVKLDRNSRIQSVTVTSGGTGYKSAPALVIT